MYKRERKQQPEKSGQGRNGMVISKPNLGVSKLGLDLCSLLFAGEDPQVQRRRERARVFVT